MDDCGLVPDCRFHVRNRKPRRMVTVMTDLRENTVCVCLRVRGCVDVRMCVCMRRFFFLSLGNQHSLT